MSELENRLARQKLLQTAIVLAAGLNRNMPGHAKRLLKEKFGVNSLECEIEAECQQLAADSMRELARLKVGGAS